MGQYNTPPDLAALITETRTRLSTLERQAGVNAIDRQPLTVESPFSPQGDAVASQVAKGIVLVSFSFEWSGSHVGSTILTLPEKYRPWHALMVPIAVDLGVSTEFGAVTISDLGGVRLAAQPAVPDAAVGYVHVTYLRPVAG